MSISMNETPRPGLQTGAQERFQSTEAPLQGFVLWPPEVAATYRRKGYRKGRTLGQELDKQSAHGRIALGLARQQVSLLI